MKRTAGGCRKEAPSFSSNPRVHFFLRSNIVRRLDFNIIIINFLQKNKEIT